MSLTKKIHEAFRLFTEDLVLAWVELDGDVWRLNACKVSERFAPDAFLFFPERVKARLRPSHFFFGDHGEVVGRENLAGWDRVLASKGYKRRGGWKWEQADGRNWFVMCISERGAR